MLELMGRSALITGGARGFGKSAALMLARQGASVAVADVATGESVGAYSAATADDLDQVVKEISALGQPALGIRADVTKSADCKRMADQTIAAFGKIDILIANAGVGGCGDVAWDQTEELWDLTLAVNLKGVWLTTKYVVPHMIERRYGKIVVTSSRDGLKSEEACAAYIASKHGVMGYMKSLAMEVGSFNINVNAICPTGMGKIEEGGSPNRFWDLRVGHANATAADFEEWSDKQNLIQLGRQPAFEEVAEGLLWLVSDRSRLMTGSSLVMDAGYIVKRGG